MDGVEGVDYVIAEVAVRDLELGYKPYGAGDRVPMADAIKYGLVDAPKKAPAKKAPLGRRRAKKATEDRARKPREDR